MQKRDIHRKRSEAADAQAKKSEKNHELMEMLDSAFSEDVSEISEISEMEENSETASSGNKSVFYFVLGIIMIVLSIIGLSVSVGFIAGKIHSIMDNTAQKNDFERFIYPVVICDPPAFEQASKLRNETLISAAVWDIILYEDKSKYGADFDYIIVPAVDIEQHAAKLFGDGLKIEHHTITAEITFYYDEEINSYRIPENPKYFTYSPTIEEIKRNGDGYVLTVGYLSPTPAWLAQTTQEEPVPDKYVDYVLQKHGSEYILSSIKHSEKTTEASDGGL